MRAVGALQTKAGSEQSKANPGQPEARDSNLRPSPNSGLRILAKDPASPPAGSPKRDNVKLSPSSSIHVQGLPPVGASPSSPERQAAVRFEDETMSGGSHRPPIASRSAPLKSTIEEQWGVLFDDRGYATKRLAQVLKGLANYIVSRLCEL